MDILPTTMAKQGPEADLAGRLLAWYRRHGRDLPWRARRGIMPEPYKVWLSEIMLQQTTVQTVGPYFEKFIAKWPTVETLAEAPLDAILRAWAGLGYYARARNLHDCARKIVAEHAGNFPHAIDELRKLPGIGAYTSAAIAAIAFGKPHAAVDGNVERVISRLYAITEPRPRSKPQIASYANALVPSSGAGDFAQALMDLGATICTPRNPKCADCPWADDCRGRIAGIAASLPHRNEKPAVPRRFGVAYWVERTDGSVLLRRRPEKGLLGGMMEVPTSVWASKRPASPKREAPLRTEWKQLEGAVRHTFTHFRLELSVVRATVPKSARIHGKEYRWVSRENLAAEALPTLMRKVIALAQKP